MKRLSDESGSSEEAGNSSFSLRCGFLAAGCVRRSIRLLGITWVALMLTGFVTPLLGFTGRSGVLPIMAVAWLGFPAGILLALMAQVADLLGILGWLASGGRGGYLAATGRLDSRRWLIGYPLFLCIFWLLLPVMVFCCMPVFC